MKKILATSVIAATASALSAPVLAGVEGNIGVTSNYLWRGVSQSNNAASVSGGLDYSNDSGFYAGTWVGSLGDEDSGFTGSETDLYFGFGGDLGEGMGYDVGYIYYHYPQLDDADFGEIYGSFSFSVITIGAAYTVNTQVDPEDGSAFVDGDLYTYISAGFDLEDNWSIGFTIGSYMFDQDGEDNIPEGIVDPEYDYTHYQIDLTKSTDMGDFTFTLSQASDSEDLVAPDVLDETNVVVSWGKSF